MRGNIWTPVFYTVIYSHVIWGYPVDSRNGVPSSASRSVVKIFKSGFDMIHKDQEQHLNGDKTLSQQSTNLGSLETKLFLQTNFFDISNSPTAAARPNNRGVSVHMTSRDKQRSPQVNNIATSHRAAFEANLQIPHAAKHEWAGSLRRAQTATDADIIKRGQISQHRLHQHDPSGVDFLRSRAVNPDRNPVVYHMRGEVPGSVLHVAPEKLRHKSTADSAETKYTYNSTAGAEKFNNVDVIEKAEALSSNLETAPRPVTRTTTMVLLISSTIVVLLVTCVSVTVFQCCCKKKRNSEELQESAENEEKQETENALPSRDRNSLHEQTPCYRPVTLSSSEDGLEEVPQLSVRDKIKAFEGQKKADQNNKSVASPEHAGKPVRKRPKSRAFEEFESQGIIIGMGMVKQGRPKSTTDLDADIELSSPLTDNDTGLLGEIMASMSADYSNGSVLSDSHSQENRPQHSLSQEAETDVSTSYVDDDDEFSVIQRNTQILRSFKRAPPPKNRTKSKRASRRRLPLQDTTNLSTNDDSVNLSTSTRNDDWEEKPTDTSVQRVRPDLGSPSIHSSESVSDITKMKVIDIPINGALSKSPKQVSKPSTESIRMYENPCYESIDVVRNSASRIESGEMPSNGTHKPLAQDSKSSRKTPPIDETKGQKRISPPKSNERISPPKSDNRISPPKSDTQTSPQKSDDKISSPKSDDRISSPKGDEDISPPKSDSRISPPKGSDWISPPKSDTRISPPKGSEQISQTKGDSRISPPKGDNRIFLPKGNNSHALPTKSQMRMSPLRSDIRDLPPDNEGSPNSSKQNTRISPMESENRSLPSRNQSSTSAPKNGSRESPKKDEEKDHKREEQANNNTPQSLKQTHL